MEKKYSYYISLFLYALKNKSIVLKNNLFRYVYIYNVSTEYLVGNELINEDVIIDKELGLANSTELINALNELNSMGYVTVQGSEIIINVSLIDYIENIKSTSEKLKNDLNNIMYFVNIVAQYNEDVILSAFFNEPNVEDAISRNKKSITLNNNQLKIMLEEFENASSINKDISIEKYDVFTAWLDYIFEEYLKEKKLDE